MASTTVTRLFAGQTGEKSVSTLTGQSVGRITHLKSYVVVYAVDVDDPEDDQTIVLAANGIPRLGDGYSFGRGTDYEAKLKALNPSRVEGTRLRWIIVCTYDNQPESPLDWREQLEVSKTVFAKPVTDAIVRTDILSDLKPAGHRAINSRGPIQVASGEVVDPPPEIDDAMLFLRITKYESEWCQSGNPGGVVINNDSFEIRKPGFIRSVDRYEAKLFPSDGTLSYYTTSAGAINPYWVNVYDIALNKLGWRLNETNRGYCRRKNPGDPDGNGGTVASDFVSTALDKGLPFMARLTDSDGNPIGPLLLDRDGQPLKGNQAVYIPYSAYEETPFGGFSLWA